MSVYVVSLVRSKHQNNFKTLFLPVLQRRLRRSQPGDRDTERRARYVVLADQVAPFDRIRIAAMFSAQPNLEIGSSSAAGFHTDLHDLPDPIPVDRLERVLRQNPILDVFD